MPISVLPASDSRQNPKQASPQSFVAQLHPQQAIQRVSGKKAAPTMTQYSTQECCPVHPGHQIRKQTSLCGDECISQNSKDGATEAAPQQNLVDELHSAKDPDSTTTALEKITKELRNNVTYREEEVLKAALRAMEKYSLRPTVQVTGCAFLQRLVFIDNSIQFTIDKHGGIDAILTAMKVHPKVAAVQERACGALWSLSAYDDKKIKIAAKGGIVAILTAMKNHPKDAVVQKESTAALRNLSRYNDNNKIRDRG